MLGRADSRDRASHRSQRTVTRRACFLVVDAKVRVVGEKVELVTQALDHRAGQKEEARLQEEKRLRREAEELRQRLEEEDRRRRENEVAATTQKGEDEALAEAAAREAAGDRQTAELILEHAVRQTATIPEPAPQVPVVVLTPVVAVTTPKVRGVGFRQVPKWRMECGHERADDSRCAACQSVPREYLVLDPKRVQARVNGFGVNANIPGIEVWMECETRYLR